jgi:hypothetical protein
MQSLEEQLLTAPARNWTTSEEADICCFPGWQAASEEQGWAYMEDDHIATQVGDRLEPVGDNLYVITWKEDLQAEYGEFTACSSLRHALEIFLNHK